MFLPKFLLKWKFGKPKHTSLTYEELVEVYYKKIDEGFETEKRFVPVIKQEKDAKEKLITRFEHVAKKYLDQVRYYWEDENIDNYQIPHPVLGMITSGSCFISTYSTIHIITKPCVAGKMKRRNFQSQNKVQLVTFAPLCCNILKMKTATPLQLKNLKQVHG